MRYFIVSIAGRIHRRCAGDIKPTSPSNKQAARHNRRSSSPCVQQSLFLRATQILLLVATAVGIASDALRSEPGPDQRHPPIMPQRLHGALLERDARRPGGAALPAAARVVLSASCQQAVSAIKAPAAAKAKAPPAKAKTAAAPADSQPLRQKQLHPRRRRPPRRRQGSVEESAARGHRPRLRRRLPHPLPRHSAGHRRGRRLPETQRDDIVGGVPARARGVAAAKSKLARRPRSAAPVAAPAPVARAAPSPRPASSSRRRCWSRRAKRCSSCARPAAATTSGSAVGFVSARAGSRRACTTTRPTCRRPARPRSPRCAKAAEALPCQARGNAFEPRKPQREK